MSYAKTQKNHSVWSLGTMIPIFLLVNRPRPVKNLALFFLYLKHMAQEGETLIVEEPEIALHPDNQLLLARLIVKLINAGLHIMVTTHSQYFLEQLSPLRSGRRPTQ